MNKSLKIVLQTIIIIIIIIGLYFISRYNYLLFHYITEFISIAIGVTIFIIALNSINMANSLFLFLAGLTFITSSLIDFLHTLAYKGQDIFHGFDSNLPTQLWIAARFIQITGLLASGFLIKKPVTRKNAAAATAIFSLFFLAVIFTTIIIKVFPACYIEGMGITLFKKTAEYVFSALALLAIIVFIVEIKKTKKQEHYLIISSLSFFILSELSFTLYVDVYGFFNMLGHIFKIMSFYFIYIYYVTTSLRNPYNLLFNNLVEKNKELLIAATFDGLTGLKNQGTVYNEAKNQFDIAKRFNKNFSVVIIDLDNFKNINDIAGHNAGDICLKLVAQTIARTVREVDIKGRFGGDEFLISPIDADVATAAEIAHKIQVSLNDMVFPDNSLFKKITCSGGIAGIRENITFDELLAEADSALIKSKESGKDRIIIYDRDNF